MQCVKWGEQGASIVPFGSIRCSSCGTIEGFVVKYNDAAVAWKYAGRDQEGKVVYQPSGAKGQWQRDTIPKSVTCIKCYKSIPNWQLRLNKYFR